MSFILIPDILSIIDTVKLKLLLIWVVIGGSLILHVNIGSPTLIKFPLIAIGLNFDLSNNQN
jgi:hypothetical protein